MKRVLDVCCGPRTFWYDPQDGRAIFGDIREGEETLPCGITVKVHPDLAMDFRDIPFPSNTFDLVVFDPPHLKQGGHGWMTLKYGKLDKTWQEDLKKGFKECFRVLRSAGTLIFKWNETQIPLREILALTTEKPLFGHKSGKQMKTHWVAFIKGGE